MNHLEILHRGYSNAILTHLSIAGLKVMEPTSLPSGFHYYFQLCIKTEPMALRENLYQNKTG